MRIDDLLLCLNLKPAVESRPNFGPSAAASVDAPCKGLGLGAAELGAAGVISSLPTALGTSAALPTAVQNPRQPMHWQQLPPQLERKLDVLRNDAEPVCRLKSIQHAQHGVHATVPSEVTHRPLVPVSTSADFAGPKAAETWGSQSHMLQTVLPDNASCQIPPVLPVGKRQAPGTGPTIREKRCKRLAEIPSPALNNSCAATSVSLETARTPQLDAADDICVFLRSVSGTAHTAEAPQPLEVDRRVTVLGPALAAKLLLAQEFCPGARPTELSSVVFGGTSAAAGFIFKEWNANRRKKARVGTKSDRWHNSGGSKGSTDYSVDPNSPTKPPVAVAGDATAVAAAAAAVTGTVVVRRRYGSVSTTWGEKLRYHQYRLLVLGKNASSGKTQVDEDREGPVLFHVLPQRQKDLPAKTGACLQVMVPG